MRQSMLDSINRNPTKVKFFVGSVLTSETVRLTHESASVPTNRNIPVGYGTSFSMFCQLRHDTQITENAVLIDGSIGWKVGPVDPLKTEGVIYGRRSALTKVVLGTSATITSAKIGAVAGVINQNTKNITFTLPIGTNVTALTPIIIHTGKIISKTGVQNFTNPVEYVITAEDLSTKIYTITVEVAV